MFSIFVFVQKLENIFICISFWPMIEEIYVCAYMHVHTYEHHDVNRFICIFALSSNYIYIYNFMQKGDIYIVETYISSSSVTGIYMYNIFLLVFSVMELNIHIHLLAPCGKSIYNYRRLLHNGNIY